MVENIKFNPIVPSLSPAGKVNRVASRGRHSQQPPFNQRLANQPKKKKKDQSEQDGQTDTEKSSGAKAHPPKAGVKRAAHGGRPGESAPSKLIDIRV
ncbi:hypothetical protein D1AOALGA4SA_5917 [Olavius algarvensis Delta 1 endosymbiont]|nr:hypothetical protein D1AOALGA4SA_5917 [Olavius algarvensis Delta 1 endosymbiont]